MKAGGEAGRGPRRSSRYSARPCDDVRGTCVHTTLPRRGGCLPQFRVQVTKTGAARETGSEQEVTGEKTHAMCVCVVCVCTRCVCTWCVCVRGVCVHVVCVCMVCVRGVCAWCAHVCGCVCVQREHNPVTMASTAHTWAWVVTSRPGHRTGSEVSRLWPRGLCGHLPHESVVKVCGEAVSTGPSELTRLVAVGK